MNRRIVLFLGVTLLAGWLAGLCVGHAARLSIPAPGPRPTPLIPHMPDSTERSPPAAASGTTFRPTPTDWTNLLAAVKVAIPPPIRGSGIIRGAVLTESGKPLPGVRIRIVPNNIPWDVLSHGPGRAHRGTSPDTRPEDLVRSIVQRHKLQAAYQRETVTDSAGAYQVADLEHTGHNVSASLAGYQLSPTAGARVYNVIPDADIPFSARQIHELPCQVINPDGQPASTATIRWEREGTQSATPWSEEQPRLNLPAGSYTMRAQGGANGEWESDPAIVQISPESIPPLTFRLKEKPGIRGRIVFDRSFTPGNLQIFARLIPDDSFPEPAALSRSSLRAWPRAHDDYRFFIPQVPPGRYAVGALDSRRQRLLASDTITVLDRVVDCDLKVAMPARDNYLIARVYSPEHRPLPAVTFLVASGNNPPAALDDYAWGPLPDGAWWILHPDADPGDPTAPCHLTVKSADYGSRTVEYERLAASEVTVLFEPAGSLTVIVSGFPGDPGKTRLALALRQPNRKEDLASFPISGNGPIHFASLAPGPHDLRLTSASLRNRWPLDIQSLVLRPGANVASIQVPPLHTLRVTAPDPAFGDHIHLTLKDDRNGWSSEYTKLDPSTRQLTFEGLPAGHYAVKMVHSERTGRVDIAVPETGDLLFDPPPLNALEVIVKDTSGNLSRSGFQTGDLIVAINGVPFRRIDTLSMALDGYKGMKDITLTVLRNRRFVDIKVDMDKLYPGGADGWLSSQSVQWE